MNLETADDEQNSLSTKNEKIIITASDGVRLVKTIWEIAQYLCISRFSFL